MSNNDYDTTLMNGVGAQVAPQKIYLGLLYLGKEYAIKPGDAPFVIGRDEDSCHLCIRNRYSSRKHCTIEYSGTKFVLSDNSTNGTYLQLGRAHNLRVHNESVPLIGHGCFKLGKDFRPDDPELVHFVIRTLPQ